MDFSLCYFDKNTQVVGYTLNDRCDCVFVYKPSVFYPSPPKTLTQDQLIQLWRAAAVTSEFQLRSIHFFRRIKDPKQATKFIEAGIKLKCWDRLIYWPSNDATGTPELFPKDNHDGVAIKQILVDLYSGNHTKMPLKNLQGLRIDWDPGDETGLILGKNDFHWEARDRDSGKELATSQFLRIEFEDPNGIDTGGLRLGIPAASTPLLPLKFAYYRAKNGPNPKEIHLDESLTARFVDYTRTTSAIAHLVLDPRDQSPAAFAAHESWSRIEFIPQQVFASHFVTDRGQALRLKVDGSSNRGIARLLYQIKSIKPKSKGKWECLSDSVSFAPHGDFILAGLQGGNDTLEKVRLLAGSTATEGVDFVIGERISFDSRGPAVIYKKAEDLEPPPESPENPANKVVENLIHDAGGAITTSWLRHGPSALPFYSEPESSPLFDLAPEALAKDLNVPLTRKNLKFGDLKTPIPVLPWAGATPASSSSLYENQFLAEARRRLVPRPPSTAISKLAVKEESFGITPQGIVCSYLGDDYTGLYFGNPEVGAQGAEFSIQISKKGAGVSGFQEFQKALRSNDLFMVWSKPELDLSIHIHPSLQLSIAGFKFTLELGFTANGQPSINSKTVLILKYYRGLSLAKLVEKEELWACKSFLAEAATAATIKDLALVDNAPPLPLKDIWDDPEWQGLLILNLNPSGPPNLFAALAPAMTEEGFRVHHIALNSMPVSGETMTVAPQRKGSAFGLIRYNKSGAGPDAPKTADKEPGAPTSAGREYGLIVENLEVEFANSKVSRFQALVNASFSHLFWDKTSDLSTVVPLTGYFESRQNPNGGTEDLFSLRCEKKVTVTFGSSWIESFTISRAELAVTGTRPETGTSPSSVISFLGFNGDLALKPTPGLPFFVDSVNVQRLGLQFDYTPATKNPNGSEKTPRIFKCGFHADSISAEIQSGTTPSFLSLLPVKFLGFRLAVDELLDLGTMGFISITGLPNAKFHFVLDFELDLGFSGNLGGGKGLRLPLLLGWRAGIDGLPSIGISFPNWNGESFEFGIERFISIRAKKAELMLCPKNEPNNVTAVAIGLSNAKLAFFGSEWPENVEIDVALFAPVKNGRRMSWAIGAKGSGDSIVKYLGAGHRIQIPPGETTEEIVDNFRGQVGLVENGKLCDLIDKKDQTDDWVVVADFNFSEAFKLMMAISDRKPVYGLRLDIFKGLTIDAVYCQLTEKLGVFSTEVGLPPRFRTIQIGAATVRLPVMGVEVYTDGGFRFDLGYPWNLDFTRSFQLEIVIFLGSGGFWFGYTSAAATKLLELKSKQYEFDPPQAEYLAENYQSLSAGMAMRAGIGRTLDLGILKGEASLTVFCTLEGAIGYLKHDSAQDPHLHSLRGTLGVMIHVWAEVDFVVLRAKAEFCAYVLVGFHLSRVLAYKNTGPEDERGHYYLTLPLQIFAEVGIYVHAEVWVTIGCVQVKLFDLNFSATWRWEETITSLKPEHVDPQIAGKKQFLAPPKPKPFVWDAAYQPVGIPKPFILFASMLPCAVEALSGKAQPGVVTQLMVGVDDGFKNLAKFMLGWVMQVSVQNNPEIHRSEVIFRRNELQDGLLYWLDPDKAAPQIPLDVIKDWFDPKIIPLDPSIPASDYAALPGWLDVNWGFNPPDPKGEAAYRNNPIDFLKAARSIDGFTCSFVDYLRALTDGLLAEAARIILSEWSKDKNPDDASLAWDDLWDKFGSETSIRERADSPVKKPNPLLNFAQDLNRTLLHGARRENISGKVVPAAVFDGRQAEATVAQIKDGVRFLIANAPVASLKPDAKGVDDANKSATEALSHPNVYFKITEDRQIPTWMYHRKLLSLPANPVIEDLVLLDDDSRKLLRLPAAILREAATHKAFENDPKGLPSISLCRLVETKTDSGAIYQKLDPLAAPDLGEKGDWQPALLLRCPLNPAWSEVAKTKDKAASAENVFEIAGIPQSQRWYLDHLLGSQVDLTASDLIMWIELPRKEGSSAPAVRLEIEKWTLARRNLSGLARPGQETKVASPSPNKILPYTATELEAADTLQLLQMASITNGGGYYLRVKKLKKPEKLALEKHTLVIGVMLRAEATEGKSSAVDLPLHANAVIFAANQQNEELEPAVIRFEGQQHVVIEPYAPPGCLAFGWRRELPELAHPQDNHPGTTEGFARSIHLLDYEVKNGNGVLCNQFKAHFPEKEDGRHAKQGSPEECRGGLGPAISPVQPLAGQKLPGQPGADDPIQIMATDAPPAAPTPQAGGSPPADAYHHYRNTIRFAPEEDGFKYLADPATRKFEVTAGFRDIFGNRLLASLGAQDLKLTYTDTLTAPAEWPGFRFRVYPDPAVASKMILEARCETAVAIRGRNQQPLVNDADRIRQLTRIRAQLIGAASDVEAVVENRGTTKTFSMNVGLDPSGKSLVRCLQEMVEFAISNENSIKTFPVTVTGALAQGPAHFSPALVVRRTNATFLPTEPTSGEDLLVDAAFAQVRSAESYLALQASETEPGGGADDPSFAAIAAAFAKAFSNQFNCQFGIRRNRFNEQELWFVPNTVFPTVEPKRAPVFSSPRPLKNTLGSDTFKQPGFTQRIDEPVDTWKKFNLPLYKVGVSDVDHDLLGRRVFNLLEELSAPAEITRDLLDKDSKLLWTRILASKDRLAQILGGVSEVDGSQFVVPVDTMAPSSLPGIRRMCLDSFQRDLRLYYGVDAVVQWPISLEKTVKGITNYYGRSKSSFTRSPAIAAITPAEPKFSDFVLNFAEDSESKTLTVTYDLPPGDEATTGWSTSSFHAEITHIQLSDSPEDDKHPFNPGRWLEMVPLTDLSNNAIPSPLRLDYTAGYTVPTADRRFPKTPILSSAVPISIKDSRPVPKKPDLEELSKWGWKIVMAAEGNKEDVAYLNIDYDLPEQKADLSINASDPNQDWKPENLLQTLVVLDSLASMPLPWWSTKEGETAKTTLPFLLEHLADELQSQEVTRVGVGEPPIQDGFEIRFNDLKNIVALASNQRIKEVYADAPEDAGELKNFTIITGTEKNKASFPLNLTAKLLTRNFKPSLTLLRNDNLAGKNTNSKLIYRCGPVIFPTEVRAANYWRDPISFTRSPGMSLTNAIKSAFESIFGANADLSGFEIRFDCRHAFNAGDAELQNFYNLFPTLISTTSLAAAAEDIVSNYRNRLGKDNLEQRIKAIDSPNLLIGLKVSKKGERRILLDVNSLCFDLNTYPVGEHPML